MESESSLPHSQVPATCPYPEPVRASPHPHIPHPEDLQVPHFISHFRCLGRTRVLVQVRRFLCERFVRGYIFTVRNCTHLANPQAGPPFFGCLRLLIQYIRSYTPYWRPFLYPQHEDAPCRGDSDPLHMAQLLYYSR